MGVVACVFRRTQSGETILQVYGIDENSKGFHLLTVRQSQLDAAIGEICHRRLAGRTRPCRHVGGSQCHD